METCKKSKQLKQARLSFGQIKALAEDKENALLNYDTKNKPLLKSENDDYSLNNDGVVFNCILRQKNTLNKNQIEVKVDVHQTIQCPEVSTSSVESEVEKSIEGIDLTEDIDDEKDSEPVCKISAEASKHIDVVIDSVIERGLNDAESLFSIINVSRDARKRHARSPCFENGSTLPVLINGVTDKMTTPNKKPRRSILDMLSATTKKAEKTRNEIDCEVSDLTAKTQPMEIDLTDNKLEPNCDKTSTVINSNVDENSGEFGFATVDNSKTIGKVTTNNTSKLPSKNEVISISPSFKTKSSKDVFSPHVEIINLCANESDSKKKNSDSLSCSGEDGKKKHSPNPKLISSRKSAEMIKIKEEKEKEREEKRKQKEDEKRLREKEKLELKHKKEEERLQREEEKRRRKEEAVKLKDEKQKKKQEEAEKKKIELEAKRLEKEKKEEEKKREKEQKEVEKRVKEEEKQKVMQEKKRVAVKQATSFKSFFTPSTRTTPVRKSVEKTIGTFIPFQLKEDMFLSPRPGKLSEETKSKLEDSFQEQKFVASSYLSQLKKIAAIRCRPRTIPKQKPKLLSLSDDGLEILISADRTKSSQFRMKLLQFSENVRPPYYGTWKNKNKKLNGRNPFRKVEDLLDYDFDSEAEWEDVGEGEDIANSDGEEEGAGEEEEDDGDGFFVPHGYLSDDEGINEGEEEDINEERSVQKLKMKQQEFENSFKQKIKALVPLTIGCLWEDDKIISNLQLTELQKYEAQFFIPGPIDLNEKLAINENKSESKTPSSNKKRVPEEALPDLIRMLHGNPHRLGKLVPEFQEYWRRKNADTCKSSLSASNNLSVENSPSASTSFTSSPRGSPSLVSGVLEKSPFFISKTQLLKKFKEIGIYAKKENYSRACWLVIDAVFEKYSLNPNDYPIPCKWDYLTFEPDSKLYPTEITLVISEPKSTDPPIKGNIHKFATKMSAETLLEKSKMRIEKEKQQSTQPLEKFVTAKITPEQLLKNSRQKIEQDEGKQKRRINLMTISPTSDKESNLFGCSDNIDENLISNTSSFGVPSHEAFKSFFKVEENKQEEKTEAMETVNKYDDVIKMDVCPKENNDANN